MTGPVGGPGDSPIAREDAAISRVASSERVKAFTDAVVAIAMTLLILPLLDSVGEAAQQDLTTLEWLQDNFGSIIAFLISFVIIANFWTTHHRVFARVERVSEPLLWLTIAWMLTIVWLPVATAMTGQMKSDALQYVLYIGSMALTSILLMCTRLYLRAHPQLHDIPREALTSGIIADVLISALFVVAMLIAILVPGVGYNAMFLLLLSVPIHRLVGRWRPVSVR
ncbi:TMEM175 family protein [Microbacterium rhizomatis]|uniref:DUF1211 domain-containing protein n=1 Tax=Microbacterium rhizomatis TaxID=1631477 RepID=A0A5J5J4J2_9MICO|nr:TMEM175 family protein [Microbacterium rhizomatis]KAA9108459.1 DUF1211 domain-containing protein [Microbacterium rhizomatis]